MNILKQRFIIAYIFAVLIACKAEKAVFYVKTKNKDSIVLTTNDLKCVKKIAMF
jgi:uncharacterized protein YlbG (UPF0298 family)